MLFRSTHPHFDHLSDEDIKIIETENTIFIAPKACGSLKKKNHFHELNVGEKFDSDNINFEAVFAYNTNKNFHTKEMKFIGIILTIENKRIYHAGDTDVIEEMKTYGELDVSMLPISGTYVMTAEEGVVAANEYLKSKYYIPMHFDRIVGDLNMAKHFIENVKNGVLPEF